MNSDADLVRSDWLARNPEPQRETGWRAATTADIGELRLCFSRISRHRGIEPDVVMVVKNAKGLIVRSAMRYREAGKWIRWGVQNHPWSNIAESWSQTMAWLRPLIGDVNAIEVFPSDEGIVNTAPVRWFWIIPGDGLPSQFDLRDPQR